MSYRELRANLGWAPNISCQLYESLLGAIPTAWLSSINRAADRHQASPSENLETLVRGMPHTPGSWVKDSSGRVGRVERRAARVLHCFSGRAGREDGLAASLATMGIECVEIDTIIHKVRHDLLDDKVYDLLCKAARSGQFNVGIFGIPCSTFSVARIRDPTDAGNKGPTQVRSRDTDSRHGLTGLDRVVGVSQPMTGVPPY
jgi:hypothetical protein